MSAGLAKERRTTLRNAVWAAQDQDQEQMRHINTMDRLFLLILEAADNPDAVRTLAEQGRDRAGRSRECERGDIERNGLMASIVDIKEWEAAHEH